MNVNGDGVPRLGSGWMRRGLGAVLAFVLMFGAGCGGKAPGPNVLLITLDTTRADRLGCYGYEAADTPALDRLAAEGVLFERAYTTAPITLPAHASILTGRYPPEHGLRINGAASLPPEIPSIAETFAAEGYRTGAFIGAFVLDSKFGLDRGFEIYDDDLTGAEEVEQDLHRYRNGRLVVDSALSWLRGEDDRPFFCWVHLFDPHAPYHAHRDLFRERFADRPYDAEIAFADRQIQRLLDRLDASGERERTVIMVVGDHGEGLGDHGESRHGYQLYDTTLRVPLIVSWPGRVSPGLRVDDVVSVVSVPDTLADVAGVRVDAGFGRVSLVPAFGGGALAEEVFYAETDGPFLEHGWCPQRAVVTRDWKYIRSTRPELYRLSEDPMETANLVDELPERAQDLDDRLYEMEGRMRVSGAATAHLSDEERKVLESLGYAGRRAETSPAPESVLPDIKDKLWLINQNAEARELIQAGREDEGVALLRATADADPGHSMFRWELGRGLYALKRYREAAEVFEGFLAMEPESTSALNQLGLSYYRMGDPDRAEAQYRRAAELEPDSHRALSNLAVLYLETDRLEAAEEAAEAALGRSPDSLDLRQNLAIILERQGRDADAAELWRQILIREPFHETASRRLQQALERSERSSEDGPAAAVGGETDPTAEN